VSLVVGQEVTIYGDTLIAIPIDNPLVVEYTCDIGTQVGNNLVITPVAGDVGDHSLRIVFRNGGYTIEDQTITLAVIAEAPSGTKKILMIGDSTMNGGAVPYATAIDAILDSCTFTYLGTSGTTVGWEWVGHWHNAITGTLPTSMFVKAGVLNIPAYFTDNSIDTPDYVFIRLGINDTFSHCAIGGNGLTDAEIVAILDDAKTFIDAMLAFDSDLKIVLGLPTLCDKDGVGWDNDYDTAVYSQDMFIENMHKYWVAFVAEFEGGAYDARVDVSYEVIHLDRANYPTSGVHPSATGYSQLGIGMAAKFNELLKADWVPTGLSLTWVNDYCQIDFADATGGVAQHEIWSSKNGADYVLVATLDAGTVTYNDATWQNASMNYRVRAKDGTWYSDYTTVVNIVTPLVLKTDQSTLTTITFTPGFAIAGTVNIDWGDGSNQDITVGSPAVSKDYGVGNEQNPYFITFTGDLSSLSGFIWNNAPKIYGNIEKWVMPIRLTNFQLYNTKCTGDLTNFFFAPNLLVFVLYGSGCTGDVSTWVLPTSLTSLDISQLITPGWTGDMGDIVLPPNLIVINAAGYFAADPHDLAKWNLPATFEQLYMSSLAHLSSLPRGELKGIRASLGMYLTDAYMSTQIIDDFLVYAAGYFAANTPIKNAQYKFDGGNAGIPSATGLAAKASIEAAYTAAGFTATIAVNS
jgi:lysophospholipase L1-like esterase